MSDTKHTPTLCPCTWTTPCCESCTCVSPASSTGCRRCNSYGGPDQRKKRAIRLAASIDHFHAMRDMLEEASAVLKSAEASMVRLSKDGFIEFSPVKEPAHMKIDALLAQVRDKTTETITTTGER